MIAFIVVFAVGFVAGLGAFWAFEVGNQLGNLFVEKKGVDATPHSMVELERLRAENAALIERAEKAEAEVGRLTEEILCEEHIAKSLDRMFGCNHYEHGDTNRLLSHVNDEITQNAQMKAKIAEYEKERLAKSTELKNLGWICHPRAKV